MFYGRTLVSMYSKEDRSFCCTSWVLVELIPYLFSGEEVGEIERIRGCYGCPITAVEGQKTFWGMK